jgi:hypothetical protein
MHPLLGLLGGLEDQTWTSPARKAVKARSKSFGCLTIQRFSHRYSQTAFLYRRRVSLITQTMPIPLSQTDAQIHTIRCKRRTPTQPPFTEKTSASDFRRKCINDTSTVQDKIGRDEETNKIETFREAVGLLLSLEQKIEFSPRSGSSIPFPPKIIGKLCSSISRCQHLNQ